MLPALGRAVDRFLSRGEGLDERGDPYGPPLAPEETRRLLRVVQDAPSAGEPPFPTPLAPPAGGHLVGVRRFGEGARWALVAPHYGSLAHPTRLGVTAGLVRALQRRGFAVAVVEGPYHGTRALPGLPSGWGFVRADLGMTMRAFLSSAADVASLARRLREREGARTLVGVGVSLGGAAVGLAAANGARFDALGLLAAVDNPASFYATGQNREARRRTLAAAGYDPARVEDAFRPIAPSSFPAPLPAPRTTFAIPPHDGVVPAPTQEAWRRAWGGTHQRLSGHGHATALASPGVARRLAEALAATAAP